MVETNDSTPDPETTRPAAMDPREDNRNRDRGKRKAEKVASETQVDPSRVEPVGQTLGEPGKQHWDTKQPEPDASPPVSAPAVRVPAPQRGRPLA